MVYIKEFNMSLLFFAAAPANTPFAPNFRIPLYHADLLDSRFMGFVSQYVRDLERNYIKKEQLISEVPKSHLDPVEYTQHWKQHNLVEDTKLDSDPEGFNRFPKTLLQDRIFDVIRHHYLTYLDLLGYDRRKVYINVWANILRDGEYISAHSHCQTADGYLAGSIHITRSDGDFVIDKEGNQLKIATTPGAIIFFPSCLTHYTEPHQGSSERITVSFDIVLPNIASDHSFRPHRLLDDPETMPGLYEQ
jgi:hypothetical protein